MELPATPLQTSLTSNGIFPDVALHVRGELKVQESSCSMLVFAAVLFVAAVSCCFIPFEARAFLGNGPKVIYFIAGGIAWGGICVLIADLILKKLRQQIIVDLQQGTVCIQRNRAQKIISLQDVGRNPNLSGRTSFLSVELGLSPN